MSERRAAPMKPRVAAPFQLPRSAFLYPLEFRHGPAPRPPPPIDPCRGSNKHDNRHRPVARPETSQTRGHGDQAKDSADKGHRAEAGALPVAASKVQPHAELVERQRQADAI